MQNPHCDAKFFWNDLAISFPTFESSMAFPVNTCALWSEPSRKQQDGTDSKSSVRFINTLQAPHDPSSQERFVSELPRWRSQSNSVVLSLTGLALTHSEFNRNYLDYQKFCFGWAFFRRSKIFIFMILGTKKAIQFNTKSVFISLIGIFSYIFDEESSTCLRLNPFVFTIVLSWYFGNPASTICCKFRIFLV